MAEEVQAGVAVAPTYTREALAASKKYADRRDAIMVALKDGKQYTAAEAEQAVQTYLSKPVDEKKNGKE